MIPRVFLPALQENGLPGREAIGRTLLLDDAAAHHLLRVLRRQPGAHLEVFDGRGQAFMAELNSSKPASVTLIDALPPEPLPPLRLVLAQCLSTADRMDWTIEKAVELGVDTIVPLLSARSVVKLDERRAERRLAHWQRLIVAAAMQSQRRRLPAISAVCRLDRWLPGLPAIAADERRWVLWPQAQASLAAQAAPAAPAVPAAQATTGPVQSAWLLCGPESGLSDEEVALAVRLGWQPAGLGPRVLRTETAGLAGLTVLQAVLGDLR